MDKLTRTWIIHHATRSPKNWRESMIVSTIDAHQGGDAKDSPRVSRVRGEIMCSLVHQDRRDTCLSMHYAKQIPTPILL